MASGAAKKALINSEITADPVRLIGSDGEQVGIVALSEARAAAESASLDLVLIADSDPVVCKVMDYGKHVFESRKQKAAQRKRQKRTQVKEMKFHLMALELKQD